MKTIQASLVWAVFGLIPGWAAEVPAPAWWDVYGDSQLTALVAKAMNANVDLRTAGARIAEARALTGSARSSLLPSLGTSTQAQRLRGGFQQGVVRVPNVPGRDVQGGSFVAPFDTPVYSGGLDMSWELDLFGRNRAGLKAADADFQAQEQSREDVAIAVGAETARTYLELRGIEDRLSITRENRDVQTDLLELTKSRAEAGLATQLDVERQRTLLANTEAGLPALENERTIRTSRLAVLTADGSISRQLVPTAAKLMQPKLDAVRVDAALLRRRPDVRAAEVQIEAAMARLRSARSDQYPKITLSGLLGRQSTSVSGLTLGGGNFFMLGPQLQLPIFSGGRIQSNIAANDSRLTQAKLAYENALLIALEEAENAIAGCRLQQERAAKLQSAVASAVTSLDLSKEVHVAGLEDFLTVLDAQRNFLQARLLHSESVTAALVESVRLYKALGGHWPQP